MSTTTKLALSSVAMVASGFAVYSYVPSGSAVGAGLSVIALLISIILFIKFTAENAITDKNVSEKDVLTEEQLKLIGKGIK